MNAMTSIAPVSTAPRDHIPERIKRTAKTLGYALWLSEADAWMDAACVMALRLDPQERAALAFAALESLPADIADAVAEEAIFGRYPDGR